MADSSHFRSTNEVLDWAKEGIAELNRECVGFFNDRPFRKVTEFDADAAQNVVKIQSIKRLPTKIVRLATEVLNNIRHSFDQSLFAALLTIDKGTNDPLFFPWAENLSDFEGRLRRSKPIPPELWPVLRTFEPYRRGKTYAGGDDLVRELAKVANRKHTVVLTFAPVLLGGQFPSITGTMQSGSQLTIPNPKWDSVKNEVILARVPLGVTVHDDATLAFNIAFDEAVPLKGKPVVGCLSHFLAKAKSVAEGLEREATKIIGK